jgi:hypothetical protein
MGRAINLLHDAFVKIQSGGALLLEHQDFIMNIFASLYKEIPPFKEYFNYHFEKKEGNVIGSHKQHDCVLAIDKAMAELFHPQKIENRQTAEFWYELLVVGVATTLLTELTDPKKSTHNYINDGMLAFNNLSNAEKEASLGMRANNDPSEGNFATFTNVFCNFGWISIDSAAGIRQARYYKDLDCIHGCFVTRGKKSRRTDQSTDTGAFHALPEKLQSSLLAVAKKNGNKSRRQFTALLLRQCEARAEKAANAIVMKVKSTERDLINISYIKNIYHLVVGKLFARHWMSLKN